MKLENEVSKMCIYLIYDEEVKAVKNMLFAKNDIMLSRQLSDFVNSQQYPFKSYDDKLVVYAVGCYDENSGAFEFTGEDVNSYTRIHKLSDYRKE